MLIDFKLGQGSIVLRLKLLNSSVATGAGLTGLTFSSAGLIISTIADNEASATVYTQAGSTIETVTTLGTFAAPTATKCRFKEVDSTNHKGVYEIQIADARFAVSSAKSLLISISGATNCAETDAVVPLRSVDPYDSVRMGMTSLPNAAASGVNGLLTAPTTANVGLADLSRILGTALTETAGQLAGGFKKFFNIATPASTMDALTLVATATTVTNQLTAAAVAAGVWRDAVAADFTQATSIGKSVMNGVALGTGLTINAYTGDTPQTGDSYARIGATGSALTSLASAANLANVPGLVWDITLASHLTSGTTGNALNAAGSAGDPWSTALPGSYGAGTAGKLVGDNINAPISGRMATYVQPTGFLAATFPGTVASPTNITAGTITTTANLTTNNDKTGYALSSAYDPAKTAAQAGEAMALTSAERNSTADALLNRDMSAGTDSGSPTVRTVRQAMRFLRNKWSSLGTTLTDTKEDDVTASWTGTVTAAPGADPISGNDPA